MRKKGLAFFLVFVVLCLSLNATVDDTLKVTLKVETIPESVKFTTGIYTTPATNVPDDFPGNNKTITLSAKEFSQTIYVSARTNSSEAFSRKLIYTDLYRYEGDIKQKDFIELKVGMGKGQVTYSGDDSSVAELNAPTPLSDGSSKGYKIEESAEGRGLRAIYYPLTISVDNSAFTNSTAGPYKTDITIETSSI